MARCAIQICATVLCAGAQTTDFLGGQCTAPLLPLPLVDATIPQIHNAFSAGQMNCSQLLLAYQARITAYDKTTGLNSIRIINPNAMSLARQKDREVRLLCFMVRE
jgi:hypothetical protein